MRKFIVLLAIMAGTLIVSGAGASTASATGTNCQAGFGRNPQAPIYWVGWPGGFAFDPWLANCTHVNGVEFRRVWNGIPQNTGFANLSTGWFVTPPANLNPDVYGLYYSASTYGFTWVSGYPMPGCPQGGAVDVVYVKYYFRIHSDISGNWGDEYVRTGPNQAIQC